MKPRRGFSPLWVAAWSQPATLGFAVWFLFGSGRMSCGASQGYAAGISWAHSLNCCLLLAAVIAERCWDRLVYPLCSWVLVILLIGIAVH